MSVKVLRLGHRIGRDTRISSHVGLVARAFGADEIIYTGEEDKSMMGSVEDVYSRWGGGFKLSYAKNWKSATKDFDGIIVHLTMYGAQLADRIGTIRKSAKGKDLLIIVGGAKVPGEIYDLADYNIGIGNQPHSEVAALAIFLHEFFGGKELQKKFEGAELEVVPKDKGKLVKGYHDA